MACLSGMVQLFMPDGVAGFGQIAQDIFTEWGEIIN